MHAFASYSYEPHLSKDHPAKDFCALTTYENGIKKPEMPKGVEEGG
jgi:hypothetical protein